MKRAAALLLLSGVALAGEPSWPPHYGNAPEELVPYRRATPYARYFTEPQPFLGPGRDYPAPAGLKTLKIGLLAPPPNSVDASRGAMMRRGVELAIEEMNGRKASAELPFELVVREDAPLWGSAANILVDFGYKDDVLAVIGTIDNTASHVALRVALKAEVLMVNTAGSDPTLTETNIPWILKTWQDDRQHGYRLAELIVKERGLGKIVDLRVNDRYGRTGIKVFNDSVRRLGHPIAEEMRFLPRQRDLATQIERIKQVNPDAVVLWGEADDVGHAAAALRNAGIKAAFFGPDRLLDPAFLAAAGPAAEGTTITAPVDPFSADPAWRDFAARFTREFGVSPDAFAAHGYDGARILLDAIRKAGPNRFLVRDAVMGLKRYTGVSGTMLFDPTANNVAPLHVFRVEGGAFVKAGGREEKRVASR